MNRLILDCSLSTNGLKGSKINTSISNLMMEGARLHHNTLIENTVDSPSVTVVDDIKLAWIPEVCKILLHTSIYNSYTKNILLNYDLTLFLINLLSRSIFIWYLLL